MDKKDFESLLKKYPDCVSDGKKLKAFLKDLYPDVPKAIVNTLIIMADDGIISEMQMSAESSSLVSARLQKKLEDDYGLSQKIISKCFLLISNNAKQTESTISAHTHEKTTGFIDAQPKFAPRKEGSQKLDILQPKYNLKDFEIEQGVLKKYKGRSSVVVIPDSVTSIDSWAFYECYRLTSITIPDSVTSIGYEAFSGCTGLTSVTIPDSVTSIGERAFSWCSLTRVTIPDSMTSIGDSVFRDCCSLKSVTIPDSVTSIRNEAFRGCTRLTSVTIGGSVTSIGKSAFYNCCSLKSVTIPDSVMSIGNCAFCYCEKLQDIYITDIATWCNISGLNYLMNEGYSNKNLYLNNELATSITIPNGVTAIPSYAFRGCTGLTSVTIPDSVTSVGSNPFSDCTGLTSITVAKGNTKYHSAENCLIETESKTLIAGCKNSIIPTDGSVTSIGFWAFKGCTGLTSVAIPDSVTSIGGSAFNYCTGLTSITIPDSVTSIGDYAFQDCTSLTSVTIPDSVTSIGFWAFKGCTGLTSVAIPDSVTSIGGDAFRGCSKLKIYCEAVSKPSGWSSDWNPEHRPVVWGVKK